MSLSTLRFIRRRAEGQAGGQAIKRTGGQGVSYGRMYDTSELTLYQTVHANLYAIRTWMVATAHGNPPAAD